MTRKLNTHFWRSVTQRRPWACSHTQAVQGKWAALTVGCSRSLALCLSAPGSSKLNSQVVVLSHLCHPELFRSFLGSVGWGPPSCPLKAGRNAVISPGALLITQLRTKTQASPASKLRDCRELRENSSLGKWSGIPALTGVLLWVYPSNSLNPQEFPQLCPRTPNKQMSTQCRDQEP